MCVTVSVCVCVCVCVRALVLTQTCGVWRTINTMYIIMAFIPSDYPCGPYSTGKNTGYPPPPSGGGGGRYFHMYAYWVCAGNETPIFSHEFPFRSISFSQITKKSVPEHHHFTFFGGFCRSGDHHFQNFFNFNPFIASHGRGSARSAAPRLRPLSHCTNLNKKCAELGILILLRDFLNNFLALLGTSWYFLTIVNRFGKTDILEEVREYVQKYVDYLTCLVTSWRRLGASWRCLSRFLMTSWCLLDDFLMIKSSTKWSRKRQKCSKRLSRIPGTMMLRNQPTSLCLHTWPR